MGNIKVAILGARAPQEGRMPSIGYFHARELHYAGGAQIVAIANNHFLSALRTAESLKEFGIEAKPYPNLETILRQGKIDVVVVATPPETHYGLTRLALEAMCHALPEKPLCWDLNKTPEQNLMDGESLFKLANERDRIIAVSTQLASFSHEYAKLFRKINGFNPRKIYNTQFKVKIVTSGKVPDGKDPRMYMPMDLLPHALSLLAGLYPGGFIDGKMESSFSEDYLTIGFNFNRGGKTIPVVFLLGYDIPEKKELSFGLGDVYVTKTTKKDQSIRQGFSCRLTNDDKGIEMYVDDPLTISDLMFINAVKFNDARRLLVKPEEAITIFRLQYQIMKYLSGHRE